MRSQAQQKISCMRKLTELQMNFVLGLFESKKYPGWMAIASKLIENGSCIVAGTDPLWVGGIGNFVKTEPAEIEGCSLYTFHLDEFMESEYFREAHYLEVCKLKHEAELAMSKFASAMSDLEEVAAMLPSMAALDFPPSYNLYGNETKNVTLNTGDKVHYVPSYAKPSDVINGIVKSCSEDGSTAFVVFKCDDNWDEYEKYTGQSTKISDLRLGWFDRESIEKYAGTVPFMGQAVGAEMSEGVIRFTFPTGVPAGFSQKACTYFDGELISEEKHLVSIMCDAKMTAYTLLFSLINHYDKI